MAESFEKPLSKKDKLRLKREEERHKESKRLEKAEKIKTLQKWGMLIGSVVVIALLGFWFIKESTKPLPGKIFPEQGREHVTKEEWSTYKYNSNPPTSGSHDINPLGPGIYEEPQGDGHLVHSLEHGYIIMSYNCEYKPSGFHFFQQIFAHEDPNDPAHNAIPHASESGLLTHPAWESTECTELAKELETIARESKLWKIIVVPRPNMDSKIAVTAWTRLDTMNSVDKERIVDFINAFRDKGPEKTMD